MVSKREGWVSLHRKILNPDQNGQNQFSDPDALALWVHLLLRANYKPTKAVIGKQTINLNRGQLLCGRKSLSSSSGVQESKVERLLKRWENEHQIEQQTFSKYRVITVLNFDQYQNGEHQSDVSLNTLNNTNNNIYKEIFEKPTVDQVFDVMSKSLEPDIALAEAGKFWAHYETVGWRVGKGAVPMVNWMQAVNNWIGRMSQDEKTKRNGSKTIDIGSTGWSSTNQPR